MAGIKICTLLTTNSNVSIEIDWLIVFHLMDYSLQSNRQCKFVYLLLEIGGLSLFPRLLNVSTKPITVANHAHRHAVSTQITNHFYKIYRNCKVSAIVALIVPMYRSTLMELVCRVCVYVRWLMTRNKDTKRWLHWNATTSMTWSGQIIVVVNDIKCNTLYSPSGESTRHINVLRQIVSFFRFTSFL